jgi:hypothetical protein
VKEQATLTRNGITFASGTLEVAPGRAEGALSQRRELTPNYYRLSIRSGNRLIRSIILRLG